MTSNSQRLTIATTSLLLLAASCRKDDLTVVSTATTHECVKTTVELNVDSLVQCGGGWGNEPHLHYTICECDTIAFIPVNIQEPWYFERWIVEAGADDIDLFEPVLDTITVPTELWLDIHTTLNPWDHVHVGIEVFTEPCK
jgi:hypothetical protein